MLPHKFKQLVRKFLTVSGLHHVIWKFIPNGVYVFNYHRIGDKDSCVFDREVFSCTSEGFEKQCSFIKEHFNVISLEQLEQLISEDKVLDTKYALITFDDGYIDNYTEAFPILKKHSIPASFYVATDFVGGDLIPWWDEIAYILRKSSGLSYQLPSKKNKYHLKSGELESVISRIIYDAKRLSNVTVLDVLADVRDKFPKAASELGYGNHQLFMDWEQLNKMTIEGMSIGSHTLSHQMLSQLSLVLQQRELEESKHIIESQLSTDVSSVVYPVGRKHCYTNETCELAKSVGYTFGFNNEPGRITTRSIPHDLNRYCIGSNSLTELKLTVMFNLKG